MTKRCWFYHNWIYGVKTKWKNKRNETMTLYSARICEDCGRTEEIEIIPWTGWEYKPKWVRTE